MTPTKLWAQFKNLFKKDLDIEEILSHRPMREMLLGIERKSPDTEEKNRMESAHIINYSKSEDYSIFANEVWETITKTINTLADDRLDSEDVDFYRGYLSSCLDTLKISYKAKAYLESLQEKPPVQSNGHRREFVPPGR